MISIEQSKLILIILLLIGLIGCDKSSGIAKISGEKVNYPESGNGSYKIIDTKIYDSGKFIEINLRTKHLVFNTETGDFDHTDYFSKLPENKYVIDYDKIGELKITNHENQLIYQTNVVTKEGFKALEKSDIQFDWSNTGKYLLVDQVKTRKHFLIDIESKRKLDIPLDGVIIFGWSSNDERAIISNISGKDESGKNYIWDIKANTLENIGEAKGSYYWSPDSYYIFFVDIISNSSDPEDAKKHYFYKVARYDIQNKKWETVYKTEHSLMVNGFKVIDNNNFIYLSSDPNSSIKSQLLKPQVNHVTKYDISKKKEIIKVLDSFLPDQYFWSYDNKYLYYQDDHGFFKATVDF